MSRIFEIKDIENNIYYQNNKELFLQLIQILKTTRRSAVLINANIPLVNWINTVVQKLSDKEYTIQTKIYWIINNYQTFPLCQTCGKELQHKNVFRIFGQTRYTYCNNFCCRRNENEKEKIKHTLNLHKQQNPNFQNEINEKRIKTCNEKYNVNYVSQLQSVKDKTKQTCLKNYGAISYFSSKIGKEKIKQTNLDKYGVENPFQLESIKNKVKQTKLERYGNENYVNTEQMKKTKLERYGDENYVNTEQMKKTKLERYSDENYFNAEKCKATVAQHKLEDKHYTEKILKKREQTCLKRYGVKSANSLESVKKKKEQTYLKHFGVKSQNQSSEIRKKQMSHYFYDNKYFDSKPELAFYIYLVDNKINFIYQPTNKKYSYIFNGITHYYFPDFIVENQLIEIKGSHLIDNNTGKWICPWNRALDDQYEAKHQYLLQLNTKILYTCDYIQYIDYVIDKYGKGYLQQFKCIK